MANKQGTNQIVDSYIGDKLIEARYIGQTKYFDPYTTLTGNLPLSFNSRVAGALKNYRLYGDSDGSGVQTENLFVEGEYSLDGHYLKSDGSTENNQYWSISEYISVSPNTKYTMYNCAGATPGFCWYDANKNYISGDNFNNRSAVTVTSPATAKYVRLSVCTTTYAYGTKNSDVFKLVIGSAYPSYKIPILNTSGVTENSFDKDAETTSAGDSKKYTITGLVPGAEYTVSTNFVQTGDIASIYYNNGASALGFVDLEHPRTSIADSNGQVWIAIRYRDDGTAPAIYDKVLSSEIWIMLTKGSTPPDHYIPHRYESNYDLFVGDSKLYEDEYLDFSEQKIYRTIILTTHDNKDFITSDNKRFCVRRSNNG